MKRRDYSMTMRMGATAYDLTVVTSKRDVINYDLSRMTKHERKALRHSVVACVRQYQMRSNASKAKLDDMKKVIQHEG